MAQATASVQSATGRGRGWLRLYAGAESRAEAALRGALAAAGVATFVYTAPLWRSHALPPQAPPFGFATPGWLDLLAYAIALAALALLAVPHPRAVQTGGAAFAGAVAVLCAGDQTRWQPEVQMFVLCALCLAGATGRAKRQWPLALLRIYLVSVYAYSGLQKLNPDFTHYVAPWLLHPALGWLRLEGTVVGHGLWVQAGTAAALVEASLALLLTVPRLRRAGVVLAALMHGFLLLSLGPFGWNWNTVVWPWNLFMLAAVPLLFWSEKGSLIGPLRGHAVAAVIAAAFVVLPAGHLWGVVDAYPAHNLYSGFTATALTCFPPEVAASAPTAWRNWLIKRVVAVDGAAWDCLNDTGWYVAALHVPPFVATRVQAAFAASACASLQPRDAVLLERNQPAWLRVGAAPRTGWDRTYRGCAAIRDHVQTPPPGGTAP